MHTREMFGARSPLVHAPRYLMACILVLLLGAAWAQPPGFVAILGLTPDIEAGAQIAANVCSECHGDTGNGTDPAVPRLGGQVHPYLVIQLWNFRDGGRPGTEMPEIAADLTDQDIADVAAYFAAQTASAPPYEPQNAMLAERGGMVFNLGNHENGLIACAVCHGTSGEGVAQLWIPRIMGQSPEYLRATLHEFAVLPNLGVPQVSAMTIVANALTDAEMAAVVEYLSSQPWGQAP